MPIESWTAPEDTPDLAARASAMIDAALVGTDLARDAYWAAVRKGYNTPYNDPPRRSRTPARSAATVEAEVPPLPVAAMAALVGDAAAAEILAA